MHLCRLISLLTQLDRAEDGEVLRPRVAGTHELPSEMRLPKLNENRGKMQMSHIVKNHQERTNTNLRPTTKGKAKKDIKCLEDQFSAAKIYLKNKSRSCTFFLRWIPSIVPMLLSWMGIPASQPWLLRPLGRAQRALQLSLLHHHCAGSKNWAFFVFFAFAFSDFATTALVHYCTKVHCWYTHTVLCSQFVRDDILTRSCIPPSSSELKKMHNAGRATAKRTLWHQLLVLTESTVVHTPPSAFISSLCALEGQTCHISIELM